MWVADTCTRYGLGLPLSESRIGTGWKVPLNRRGSPADSLARATSASETVGPEIPVSRRGATSPSLNSRLSYDISSSPDAVERMASLSRTAASFTALPSV